MNSMRRYLILIVTAFGFLSAHAQTDHRMSPAERSAMPDYLQRVRSNRSTGFTTPPPPYVRASAEWEEIDALVVVWTTYTSIVRQIIAAARTETKVIVVCSDSNVVRTNLTANSIPLTNVEFLVTGFNSIWCRDFGPWNVYHNDIDSLYLIDWIYNRPRAKDDTVPNGIARKENLPLYATTTSPYDLIHTGGNFMCDGLGTGFSSRLVVDENPTKTEPEIDTIMNQFMGVNRYIKMNTLPYDQIHHIDMHLKLLDEETILAGEYPPGVADGPGIDSNLAYILSNYNSPFGTPYKVKRIPMPPDANGLYPDQGGDYRTYTNAVFVNKTVILPFYGQQYDTTATRLWQEAMPGYRIVGIDCNQIIPSLGAIHCITKEVSSNDPLWIVHQPLSDQLSSTVSYTVNAQIKHLSGIASASVYYRTDTTMPYSSIAMQPITGQTDQWTADIPGQSAGATVYYYIHAEANNGKTLNRPITAPAGYWRFNVDLNTGIHQNNIGHLTASLFPNPSSGWTCLQLKGEDASEVEVRLTDLMGRSVHGIYKGSVSNGSKTVWFDTRELTSGIYLVAYTEKGYTSTLKLVVR
ncbi:MAG: agmatine deiminase family protein [Bacteroidota bacterium]